MREGGDIQFTNEGWVWWLLGVLANESGTRDVLRGISTAHANAVLVNNFGFANMRYSAPENR